MNEWKNSHESSINDIYIHEKNQVFERSKGGENFDNLAEDILTQPAIGVRVEITAGLFPVSGC